MGIGVGGAALIAAGASVVSSGTNAYAQGRMNRKTRQYNKEMYERQRQDALSDWAVQNEYNSPRAQMQRYREAGLNPALIYGQSNESGVIRSSDAQSWNPRAPQIDLGEAAKTGLAAYMDVQLKQASLDNLRAQQTVILEEAALKRAQTASTLQGTSKGEFDLGLATELRSTSLEAAQANLNKTKAETATVLNANERAAAQNSSSLKEAAERILKLRLEQIQMREVTETTKKQREHIQKQIDALDKDVQLKQLDIDLKEKGVQPSDNIFFRILGRYLEQVKEVPGHWRNFNPFR